VAVDESWMKFLRPSPVAVDTCKVTDYQASRIVVTAVSRTGSETRTVAAIKNTQMWMQKKL